MLAIYNDPKQHVLAEHKYLTKQIKELPPEEILKKILKPTQRSEWEYQKFYWKWIGTMLDYYQYEQLGYSPSNPLDNQELEPAQYEFLKIASLYKLAQLNLMIYGWDLINEAADDNYRDFPFKYPRELFAEACKLEAIRGTENFLFLSEDTEQEKLKGMTLQEMRDVLRQESAFYNGKSEHQNMLQIYQASSCWHRFTIFAIFKKRLSKKTESEQKLYKAWQDFLNAHKSLKRLVCDKNHHKIKGYKPIALKWDQGFPLNSQNLQPLKRQV